MTHKVGIKGQVVIPKAIRDEIGIKPGDEIRALRGIWAGVGGGTEELLEERRRERDAEERKVQRGSGDLLDQPRRGSLHPHTGRRGGLGAPAG